jgi:hypothetical protein
MPGAAADAWTGAASAYRELPPEGPPRWGRRQWILLVLAFVPLALLLVAMAISAR